MQDRMDRLINEFFGPAWSRYFALWNGNGSEAPVPLDVYQTDKEYVVRATLPGVRSEDVELSVVGQCLSIKAKTQEEKEVSEESWLLKERNFTSFHRSINLPTEVQADKVEATLENGILTITLPKAEAVVPKAIPVKTGSAK